MADGLARLLVRLREQTRPPDEIVVTHRGLGPHAARIGEAAGRALRLVDVGEAGYYAAKDLGAAQATGELIAFGDADCWPDPRWLSHLLSPLEDGGARAAAGRTCYRADLLGTAATTIDFLYFPSPLGEKCTRNFYANNVAFLRDAFPGFGGGDGFYRGSCQVLGLRLQRDGVPVRFEPRARTVHRFPDSARELFELRMRRGGDAVELAPHLMRAYLGRSISGPLPTAVALAGRFAASVGAIGHQDMPPLGPVEAVACVATIAALSLCDAAGAALRLLGAGPDSSSLSYHRAVAPEAV